MNENQRKIIELAAKKNVFKMGFREICREAGIANPQTVIFHLKKLEEKGILYRDSGDRQVLTKPKASMIDSLFSIPVVGSANCGAPLELAETDIQSYLKISKKSLNRTRPDGLIAVRAVGNSLNNADIYGDNIKSGDYAVIDCKRHPDNGDYVLSVIDGAANLKKFYKDDKKQEIRLVSESTEPIAPIVIHKDEMDGLGYLVNGVVVRVVKQ